MNVLKFSIEWEFVDFVSKLPFDGSIELQKLASYTIQNTNPSPGQSNYFVRAGMLLDSGRIVCGSNHEYGMSKAIHAEEAAISSALDECSSKSIRAQAILVMSDRPGSVLAPCGNCRDVIKQYIDIDNTIFVSAGTSGGVAHVLPLKKFYVDRFNPYIARGDDLEAIGEAIKALEKAKELSRGRKIPGLYGLSLEGMSGRVYSGGFLPSDSFHPTLPIESAFSVLQFSSHVSETGIRKIVIATEEKSMAIPYLSRQRFSELLNICFPFTKKEIPVILGHLRRNEIDKCYATNSNKWLPFKFEL